MTIKRIIRRAGTAAEVARAAGVSVHAVRAWAARGSIPARYWGVFIKAEAATLEELQRQAAGN